MGVTWTAEQRQVIEQRDRNILVSAAAGSGKTAVLVERILSMVTDAAHPADIDTLLVVTFTRAAAAEMKERIRRALEGALEREPENVHLQRQSALVHHAQITTIHGFCTYVIQNYFHLIDLDPAYRIADEGELKLLQKEVLSQVLEEAYAGGEEAFCHFVECYAPGKNDGRLEELILKLHEFAMSYPFPGEWLEECLRAYRAADPEELLKSGWMRELLDEVRAELQNALAAAQACRETALAPGGPSLYLPMIESDIAQIEDLLETDGYEELREAFGRLTFQTLSRKKDASVEEGLREQVKKQRDEVKGLLKELAEKNCAKSPEQLWRELALCRGPVETLAELTRSFGAAYAEQKRKKNVLDFSDLEHFALQILVKKEDGRCVRTDAARELAARFTEVMIDEYQDSNYIQEFLLDAVSKTGDGGRNRFMVGDVKQSIYGFRLARPELFLEKQHTYKTERPESAGDGRAAGEKAEGRAAGEKAEGRAAEEKAEGCAAVPGGDLRIDLHKNFRSRSEILDTVNFFFRQIMARELGGIEYDDSEALYPGADYPKSPGRGQFGAHGEEELRPEAAESRFTDTELLLLDSKAPEFEERGQKRERIEAEALAVAQRIRAMVGKEPVWDRDAGVFRPLAYRDCVVLLRTVSEWADIFASVLNGQGIPAYTTSRTGYFSAVEVVTVLNYLHICDNPRQEIPFAAVLHSPIAACSAEELALIKAAWPDLPIYEACRRYAEYAQTEYGEAEHGETPESAGAKTEGARGGETADRTAEVPSGGKTADRAAEVPNRGETANRAAEVPNGGETADRTAEAAPAETQRLAEKLRRFLAQLDGFRARVNYTPIHELIAQILEETGYGWYAASMPAGRQRQANLQMLVEKAVDFEATSYRGLFNFIRYMEQIQKYEVDFGEVNIHGEAADTVRIMSIHKSKGLEFPVVFVSGLGKRFNFMDTNAAVLLHSQMGIGADAIDDVSRAKSPTLLKQVIRQRMLRETLGEELRVLYVALTRAKEKLVLTGTGDLQKWTEENRNVIYDERGHLYYGKLSRARCYMDWLLPACAGHRCFETLAGLYGERAAGRAAFWDDPAPVRIRVLPPGELAGAELFRQMKAAADRESLLRRLREMPREAELEAQRLLEQRFSYRYPYALLAEIPAAMTVTELKRAGEPGAEEEETALLFAPEEAEARIPSFIKGAEEERPRGAARGTLYHRVFERLDYCALPEGTKDSAAREELLGAVRGQIEQMVQEGRMSAEEAKEVRAEDILRFLESPLGRRMRRAACENRLAREQPFMLSVPACEINPAWDTREPVLVQGIIDAYFEEEGALVLVDYKTDRVYDGTGEALAGRYRVQLACYRRALEQVAQKKVRETLIYSVSLGKEVRVEAV